MEQCIEDTAYKRVYALFDVSRRTGLTMEGLRAVASCYKRAEEANCDATEEHMLDDRVSIQASDGEFPERQTFFLRP